MLKKVLIGVGVLVALGGFAAALMADKKKCEELHGKVSQGEVVFEPHSGDYELQILAVLERKAKLASWSAEYAGKKYSSTDPEGKEMLVRQHGKKTKRAGFLGSDLKRLYGADYKQFAYKFYVRKLRKEPAKQVIISGVIDDPAKGKITFEETVELK